jgi:hypothetical protein
MDALFECLFGHYAPLARHVFHSTLTFIFILVCFFCVKTVLSMLFPPTDYIATVLHIIDTYAGSLGLIGFIVWTSLDIALLLIARVKHSDKTG